MTGYYDEHLSAQRLKRVYEIAPLRVQQYLEAEIAHVLRGIRPGDRILDLGCGYGRTLPRLAAKAAMVVGIDNAQASLRLAREALGAIDNCRLACMDALRLGFSDATFDRVICIQNGISAFHVDRAELVRESIRVTRPGGTIMFSTYSAKLWTDRLEWFELQAAEGLLGEIDHEKTRDGVIVCKDGFTAMTPNPDDLMALMAGIGGNARITEVDNSSLFCEVVVL